MKAAQRWDIVIIGLVPVKISSGVVSQQRKSDIPLLYVIQAQTPSRILKATNSQISLKGQLSSVVLQIGKNKTL